MRAMASRSETELAALDVAVERSTTCMSTSEDPIFKARGRRRAVRGPNQ